LRHRRTPETLLALYGLVLRPQRHIWRSHDVPWLIEDAAIPSYPEWPPER
jgi:hypothetical protein